MMPCFKTRPIRLALLALVFILSISACHKSNSDGEIAPLKSNILIYGDSRTGHADHREVVAAMLSLSPGIVFHTGDLVESGADSAEWDTFNDITRPLRQTALFYPAAGNHELESNLYYDNFLLPNNEKWYTVISDSIIFVIINSNLNLDSGSEQYMWLKDVLENVDQSSIKYTAVILHHPPYTSGQHQGERPDLPRSVVPLFEQFGVDIVFNGHDHNYERLSVNGIYYIVTGGGGAPLRGIAIPNQFSQKFVKEFNFCALSMIDGKLHVTVYDKGMNIIDKFSL